MLHSNLYVHHMHAIHLIIELFSNLTISRILNNYVTEKQRVSRVHMQPCTRLS